MTTEIRRDQSKIDAPNSVDGMVSRLVSSPDDKQVWSFTRMNDTKTAIARGLSEYLGQLSINWVGGRLLRFESSRYVWSDPEDPAKYPSVVVLGEGPMMYEDSELSGKLVQVDDGRYVRKVAEAKQHFSVQLWANDQVERQGLVSMVEDALEPVEWMSGVRLELPYYFNARATYEKLSVVYEDAPMPAHRRGRKALMMVVGNVPQIIPVGSLRTFEEHPTRVKVEMQE